MKKTKKLCAILLASSLMFSQSMVANAALPGTFKVDIVAAEAALPPDLREAFERAGERVLGIGERALHNEVRSSMSIFGKIVNRLDAIKGKLESEDLTDEKREKLYRLRISCEIEINGYLKLLRNIYMVYNPLKDDKDAIFFQELLESIKEKTEVLTSLNKEVIDELKLYGEIFPRNISNKSIISKFRFPYPEKIVLSFSSRERGYLNIDKTEAIRKAIKDQKNFPYDMRRLHNLANYYASVVLEGRADVIDLINNAFSSMDITADERRVLKDISHLWCRGFKDAVVLLPDIYEKFPQLEGEARQNLYESLLQSLTKHKDKAGVLRSALNEVLKAIQERRSGSQSSGSVRFVIEADRTNEERERVFFHLVNSGCVSQLPADEMMLRGIFTYDQTNAHDRAVRSVLNSYEFVIINESDYNHQSVAPQIHLQGPSGNGFNGGFIAGPGSGKRFF